MRKLYLGSTIAVINIISRKFVVKGQSKRHGESELPLKILIQFKYLLNVASGNGCTINWTSRKLGVEIAQIEAPGWLQVC